VRACGALVCGGRRRLGTSFHRDSFTATPSQGLGTSFHRDSFTATPSQRRVRESLARLCEGVPVKGVLARIVCTLVGTFTNGFLRDGCTSETCSMPSRAAVERRDATTCQVGSRAAARASFHARA
jgi:hypothetical protein